MAFSYKRICLNGCQSRWFQGNRQTFAEMIMDLSKPAGRLPGGRLTLELGLESSQRFQGVGDFHGDLKVMAASLQASQ
jgi:hypothetical protein